MAKPCTKWIGVLLVLAVFLPASVRAAQQAGPWSGVETALGRKGTEQNGVFKIVFPRTDLKVTKADVPVSSGVALTSWVAFSSRKDQAMMMGDLVLLEQEVKPVMTKLLSQGIRVTALHNHLLGTIPNVLYLHFEGMGDPAALAQNLREALSQTATPMGEPPAPRSGAFPDWSKAEKALDATGQKKGDIIQFTFPRKEAIKQKENVIPPAMGVATAINMEMAGSKATASGDFVLVAEEVNPVAKALMDGGIEVTAIHNHMLDEFPRLFFLHFWGYDDPEKLALGLRKALDATNYKRENEATKEKK